jgi:hypothetical protein
MNTSIVITSLPIIGDLNRETWPGYLNQYQYEGAVLGIIRECDLIVKPHGRGYHDDDYMRFLVGDSKRSRKCALNRKYYSRGVILLLEDNGEIWDDADHMVPPATKPVAAVTLGELMKDTYLSVCAHLQLDRYRNKRLA